ncbi:MAG TPA: helix-turn-helix transcriptional regulator [Caldisericia bacterium]|nr:helix-turn-helix transcriptional regulator [Caldisericia bacterium]HPF49588.1 helix-turn-helix transcriptional regulator [Caldisericia bacterium]HPI84496.1 helix-turn-helix transcriptional regulator [Caldisericia bacterium]HPQ93862.1 helix-turn-helix transcriptional regulator [Caldisericia bacterium]HRV75407.1 helix-turn-helix transcriptional regulator [Caldisericia bacterium]
MTLGMVIDAALKKIGKTRSWLAKELDVSRSTVARFCSGEARPTPTQSKRLRNILGVQKTKIKRGIFCSPNQEKDQFNTAILLLRQLLFFEKTLTRKETSSIELVIGLLEEIECD